jgi:photosynthetic reaction center cytochrome c subunit
MSPVRFTLIALLIAPLALLAQRGGAPAGPPPGPPKNLKVLPADTDIRKTMGEIRTAIGENCTYCHVAGDFASDENPKKSTARNMMRITADLNAGFPDHQVHVTCWTCHRGDATPAMDAPAADGGGRGRGGRGGRGGAEQK